MRDSPFSPILTHFLPLLLLPAPSFPLISYPIPVVVAQIDRPLTGYVK